MRFRVALRTQVRAGKGWNGPPLAVACQGAPWVRWKGLAGVRQPTWERFIARSGRGVMGISPNPLQLRAARPARGGVLALDPVGRWPPSDRRVALLGYDALEPELAGMLEDERVVLLFEALIEEASAPRAGAGSRAWPCAPRAGRDDRSSPLRPHRRPRPPDHCIAPASH
jgi:hypothetical protein